MSLKIKIIIGKLKEGGYVAFCPELEGCMSQGETLEEVKENIKEAAAGWLEAKVQLQIMRLVKKNQEFKVQKNGDRIENISISTNNLSLAGA